MLRFILRGLIKNLMRYVAMYLALVCVVVTGFHVYSILSGLFEARYIATTSMEPSFPRGSIVFIIKNPYDIAIGDLVAYRYPYAPRYMMFHRVVDISSGYLLVKGDAVAAAEAVKLENVIGSYAFGIPYAGLLREMLLADPFFTYLLALLIIVVLILWPGD